MPHMKATLANRLNQDLKKIQPNEIRAFDMQVSQIPDIIKLTLGEPDFDTPEVVKQAAIDSINQNESHYTDSRGTAGLRRAAASFLATKYHLDYDPDSQILVTVGASEGIYSSLTAMLNPGDTVIIPTPIFPQYIPATLLSGGKPIFVDTSADGFILTPNVTVEDVQTADLGFANSDHNPVTLAFTLKP